MDCITAVDTVLIQSGELPDHIHHTGFGMYLPMVFTEKIAHAFGSLSAITLEELDNSLNPVVPMAELTEFLRLHSPFLAIGIIGLLCAALYVMYRTPWPCIFFFVLILGTQESLTYQASVIRTEFYSIFFWSAAVLAIFIAVKNANSISRYICFLFSGIFLGLSYQTKVQSIFYALVFVLILFHLFLYERPESKNQNREIIKADYFILGLSLVSVISFFILAVAAYQTVVPENIPTWSSGYGITKVTVFFFCSLTALFLTNLFFILRKKVNSIIFVLSAGLSVIAFGFMVSFALHLLVYPDISMSLKYMLLDFKMIFLRISYVSQLKDFDECLNNILLYVKYNPVLFVVNLLLLLILIIGRSLNFIKITKGQLLICVSITTIAILNIFLATRFSLRDLIWKELLINFSSMLYFSVILKYAVKRKYVFTAISYSLLAILFLVNCAHTKIMPDRIDGNYNNYGWQDDKWITAHFKNNHQIYKQLMFGKYNNQNVQAALMNARRHRVIRNTVDFVFKNQEITHRNIGVAFEGFPVWADNLDYRIIEVSPELRGAILVDNAGLETKENIFFEKEYLHKDIEHLDKFQKKGDKNTFSVLNRRDIKIYLFVNSDDFSGLRVAGIKPAEFFITVRNNNEVKKLYSMEIVDYCEIPLDKMTGKFFFVIK
ncbi:MAG: hypothetical protein JW804_00150 [Sedimentisphaerales bacterium]|nr:hypothetical protein [Sedimentisphaerales bacterium]